MKKYYILIILACLALNTEAKKTLEKQKNKPLLPVVGVLTNLFYSV